MVFVQSLRGLSHTKLEDTKREHLELSVEALDRLASKTLAWLAMIKSCLIRSGAARLEARGVRPRPFPKGTVGRTVEPQRGGLCTRDAPRRAHVGVRRRTCRIAVAVRGRSLAARSRGVIFTS